MAVNIETQNIVTATIRLEDVIVVVRFNDEIIDEQQQTEDIRDHLVNLIEKGKHDLLFDFSEVEFFGAVGIGMLVTVHKKIDRVNGRIIMYHVNKEIFEKLAIRKLDKVFTIVPDKEAALLEIIKERQDNLLHEDRRKIACAKHFGIDDPAKISTVELIEDSNGQPEGLRVTLEVHTGPMMNQWARRQLAK